ncbi:MAG: transcriptional repressor [Bacteroides sp.]|nr:transcriptional repressor [Bacteroides sp.]
MENREIEARLAQKGIKPTANRIIVYRELLATDRPVSLSDMEDIVPTLDKSSIFRTLTLFLEHHLLHSIEDGSGSIKYELCGGGDDCSIDDMHVHFYCTECHRTFCFESIRIPAVGLPDGFEATGVNYMVKGTCPDCSRK